MPAPPAGLALRLLQHLIVLGSSLGILQQLVGLVDLAQLLLVVVAAGVAVRMQPLRQVYVCGPDLSTARIRPDAEHVVRIDHPALPCEQTSPVRATERPMSGFDQSI